MEKTEIGVLAVNSIAVLEASSSWPRPLPGATTQRSRCPYQVDDQN
jgi:hypothetical protein